MNFNVAVVNEREEDESAFSHDNMTIFTMIARQSDGMMLAESIADKDSRIEDVDSYRAQAKKLLRLADPKTSTRMTVDTGPFYFCYIIVNDVVYLTLCEKAFPKKLAIRFLEELQKEFDIQYGTEVTAAKRPYSFVKFDAFIERTKKNLNRVTEDLSDVQKIMARNINEILYRGEKLESVSKRSDDLLAGTIAYAKQAKDLNASFFLRREGIIGLGIVGSVLTFYFYFL
ncbi:hypothetical protein PROFUN_12926 [Planoprotostelium fungivorum]|uniref:Uncharacterized protein n=1 Tax=Planoprotostelium fungivorum TaxID=1890364 RepID=A0A2P6N5Z6_9EUKA|nr:hypothetical protein PROFUN_12926 [Planoprotostelium fungivorum]